MAEFGKGLAGGALTGASTGFMIGGPVGAGIGAGVGALAGGLQAQGAKRQRLKAEAADKAINPIDPNQQAFLNRLGSLERGYRAGTDPASAFAAQGQQNALAQTQANMVRGGIGNVNNLLRSQQAANVGMAQIGAAAGQNANALIPLQANIQNAVTERLYQRQQQKRADAYSRSAQSQQDLNNLLSGGLGTALQVSGQFSQGKARPYNGQTFDPLAATSPGVGSFYPGAYNAGDLQNPVRQSPRMPQANPLSYTPAG